MDIFYQNNIKNDFKNYKILPQDLENSDQLSEKLNSSDLCSQIFNSNSGDTQILKNDENESQQCKQNTQAIQENQSQAQVVTNNQKVKPFIISRRPNNHFKVNRVVNYVELFIKNINSIDCFLMIGDFTVDKTLFTKFKSNSQEAFCPIHNYRPQVAIQTGRNYVICILNQNYNGVTDVQAPAQMLKLLQNQTAYEISQYLSTYQNYINQLFSIRKILSCSFNQQKLIEQIKQNHINSLKIAHEAMEKADKNKTYVFIYMKFDYESCSNKLYSVGGSTKFSEAYLGQNDITLMRQYCQRYSFPHFNDVSGVLNVLYSKFQSKSSYDGGLITFDEEYLPFQGFREFIPLHQTEIAPGIFVGDKFEMRELKFNEKIYQSIQNKRKETKQMETYLRIDDLGYTLEAEAFVQKFYKKSKKIKTTQLSLTSKNNPYFNSIKSNESSLDN